MATAENDIRYRIAEALGDRTLREAIEARDRYNATVVQLREAHGVTIDEDEDGWRKLTGNSKRDLSPLTQSRMQELALYLWESNLLANRIIELPIAFLLAEGVKLVAQDEIVQEWLDRFWDDPINAMDLKLVKKVRELSLFGEQCWPTFTNEVNGHVRLGYLDPALIETVVTDPDNGEQPIGIVTVKDKKGQARRYRVIVNGSEEALFTQRTRAIRETFDDGECFYFTINDLSNGKRGRSDLLAQIDWLDGYEQFLFGELDRAQFMRAFIWDVTLKNATAEDVKKRAKEIVPPPPGSTRVHNDSEEWNAVTPDLKTQDSAENARLFRNHIMGGASQPEHWYGGGGDVNRATAAEMGDPTFKMFAMRQKYIGYILQCVAKYQIRQRELATTGSEPDLSEDIYQVEVQWPEMVSSDISKYATALSQVTIAVGQAIDRDLLTYERGLQIIEKISDRLGVEFDVRAELEAAMAEASQRAEADGFVDPAEAGSAGGDE